MSALGRYSDSCSCPCSDMTRTPAHESSSSNSVRTSAYIRAQMLLRLPLTSALRCSSDSHSCPHSDATWTPAHDPTRSSVSIRATNSRNSTWTSVRASAQTSMSRFVLQVQARAFRPRLDLRPCPCYDPNLCNPTPLGHPCLTPFYKFEPVPSGPARTSVLVRVTSAVRIQTAHNTLHLKCKACCEVTSGWTSTELHIINNHHKSLQFHIFW
jgi:hypothetical protein